MVDYDEANKASHARGAGPSFGEIVGQADFKEALLAVGANDDLDGLLVQGEKGTGKSTAVRALADLLPAQRAVADCPYGCPPDDPAAQCDDCRRRADPPTTERQVPLVTLPLGATRERVIGTLSVADALGGEHEFDPGLLARANRGVLYVDEVNLLDDHLVDVLLDAAAAGVNRVERDGISVAHPASFTLVGTMNPEEGDLRPQLRDRFALQATVAACEDLDRRVAIIDSALGRKAAGAAARGAEPEDDEGHRDRLLAARDGLKDVDLPDEFTRRIAALYRDAGVDGHRGDIATARAARTFAALDGRRKVVESDVRRAAELALPHRLRSRPFEDAPDPEDVIDDHFADREGDDEGAQRGGDGNEGGAGDGDADEENASTAGEGADAERDQTGDGDSRRDDGGSGTNDGDEGGRDRGDGDGSDQGAGEGSDGAGRQRPHSQPGGDDGGGDRSPAPEAEDEPTGGAEAGTDDEASDRADGSPEPERADGRPGADDGETEATPLLPGQARPAVGEAEAPDLSVPESVEGGPATGGSRSAAPLGVDTDGPRVRSEPADDGGGVDAAASVRAAAARGAAAPDSRDLRRSVRRGNTSALVLFVVDASASMRPAMRAAKGTVLELLKDAYRQRDEVGFVAFAGDGADVLLPPTDSVTHAARHLKELPTGDRTPLPAGLRTATEVLDRADPTASVVVLVTDGRANVASGSPVAATREAARGLARSGAHVVVVDAGDEGGRGLAGLVAEETDGERVPLDALSADRVDATVGALRETEL